MFILGFGWGQVTDDNLETELSTQALPTAGGTVDGVTPPADFVPPSQPWAQPPAGYPMGFPQAPALPSFGASPSSLGLQSAPSSLGMRSTPAPTGANPPGVYTYHEDPIQKARSMYLAPGKAGESISTFNPQALTNVRSRGPLGSQSPSDLTTSIPTLPATSNFEDLDMQSFLKQEVDKKKHEADKKYLNNYLPKKVFGFSSPPPNSLLPRAETMTVRH